MEVVWGRKIYLKSAATLFTKQVAIGPLLGLLKEILCILTVQRAAKLEEEFWKQLPARCRCTSIYFTKLRISHLDEVNRWNTWSTKQFFWPLTLKSCSFAVPGAGWMHHWKSWIATYLVKSVEVPLSYVIYFNNTITFSMTSTCTM